MTEAKPARAAAKGVDFAFLGVITLNADLLPVKRPAGGVETKMVSPDIEIPTPLKQQYVVDGRSDLGPYSVSDAARAIELPGGELKFVTTEELAELRGPSLPDGECDLKVFPADEVYAATISSGVAYRLRPSKMTQGTRAQQTYAMLVDLVADMARREHPLVFVGEITVKGAQRMMRCESRDGNLVIIELVRPGELHNPVPVPLEYDARTLAAASELVDLRVDTFDPTEFQNVVRERAEAFKRSLEEGGERELPKPKESDLPDDGADLLAALSASIDMANAAKAKPTKKPRKTAAKPKTATAA